MNEYIYSFQRNNYYLSSMKKTESFGKETKVKLIISPHEYELKLSNEVLSSSSCKGYTIEISNKGAVIVFDIDGKLLAETEDTPNEFRDFGVEWKENNLSILFGHKETIDNYPNCDGEYDRWDTRWVTDYEVKFNTITNLLV